jgi:hypothetical protein
MEMERQGYRESVSDAMTDYPGTTLFNMHKHTKTIQSDKRDN